MLAIAGAALLVFATGVPALFQRSMLLAPAHIVALFSVSTKLVSLSAFAVLAALLIRRRPDDTVALLAALMLVLTQYLKGDGAAAM